MGSSAAATCTSAWVSTPPVIARVSTMGNAISFLRLKGWHAPAGRRTCEPRPLAQDGQIRPAPPVGARKPGAPADRSFRRTARAASADSEVRPGPGPRPYAHTTAKPRKQGRKHYPHPPCRFGVVFHHRTAVSLGTQIGQFGVVCVLAAADCRETLAAPSAARAQRG